MNAEQFKEWRIAHGLTQAQIASALEVTEMTVYRWETGKAAISKTVELALKTVETKLSKIKK